MAQVFFFDFQSREHAREALAVAHERDLHVELLPETEAPATIRVREAEAELAEVLMMRHGGHLREATPAQPEEDDALRTPTFAPQQEV